MFWTLQTATTGARGGGKGRQRGERWKDSARMGTMGTLGVRGVICPGAKSITEWGIPNSQTIYIQDNDHYYIKTISHNYRIRNVLMEIEAWSTTGGVASAVRREYKCRKDENKWDIQLEKVPLQWVNSHGTHTHEYRYGFHAGWVRVDPKLPMGYPWRALLIDQ